MTFLDRLVRWRDRQAISPEQYALLAGLCRRDPFSVFLELNVLLYAGILAFVAGMGWTVTTWSQQLGDIILLNVLTALLGGCFWYCFSRAPAWSSAAIASPNLIFDYVLYLGCLVWLVEFGYLEKRFEIFTGQWDFYLLLTAGLFFFLAYRFDNRLVLSLALSSLAGWFGLAIARWQFHQDGPYRQCAIAYSLLTSGAGVALQRRGLKPHFLGAYLNIAANVLFWALVSGVFEREGRALWFLCLLAACGASLVWGIRQRQFSFVVYAAIYGYVGVNSMLVRDLHNDSATIGCFLVTGIAVLIGLVRVARRFGREV